MSVGINYSFVTNCRLKNVSDYRIRTSSGSSPWPHPTIQALLKVFSHYRRVKFQWLVIRRILLVRTVFLARWALGAAGSLGKHHTNRWMRWPATSVEIKATMQTAATKAISPFFPRVQGNNNSNRLPKCPSPRVYKLSSQTLLSICFLLIWHGVNFMHWCSLV